MKLAIDIQYIEQFFKAMEEDSPIPTQDEEDDMKESIDGIFEMEYNGPIVNYAASFFTSAIKTAQRSGLAKGFIISIDSPGGDVNASVAMMSAIRSIRQPVYIHSNQLLSGGYLASIYADKIFAADKMSEVGSIGTVFTYSPEMLNFMKSFMKQVYSTKSPDKNKEFRALLEGDEAPIISKLDTVAKMFQDHVKNNRELRGDTESTLSGGNFFADNAKRRGLIDGVTDYQTVYDMLLRDVKKA